MTKKSKRRKGIALFMTMMVVGILSIVIAAVLNIAYNEIKLSNTGKESETAFFAANTGIECTLYADTKQNAFPSSLNSGNCAQASPIGSCGVATGLNTNIFVNLSSDQSCPTGSNSTTCCKYEFFANNLSGSLTDPSGGCADVIVKKFYDLTGTLSTTTIVSNGEDASNCSAMTNSDRTYQRSIEVDY